MKDENVSVIKMHLRNNKKENTKDMHLEGRQTLYAANSTF